MEHKKFLLFVRWNMEGPYSSRTGPSIFIAPGEIKLALQRSVPLIFILIRAFYHYSTFFNPKSHLLASDF
jgi:hypothetical protein